MEEIYILILFCVLCCILLSVLLGIYIAFFDGDENKSCIDPDPVPDGYNITNVSGSKAMNSFNLTGITCADGYNGNPSATACSASGTSYTLSGCNQVDPVEPDEPDDVNCMATFTEEGDLTKYTYINGTAFANYNFNSLIDTPQTDINCSSIGNIVSCSGVLNTNGSINCIGGEPSSGSINCNSSGIYVLGGCMEIPAGQGPVPDAAAATGQGPVPGPDAAAATGQGPVPDPDAATGQGPEIQVVESSGGAESAEPAAVVEPEPISPCDQNPCLNDGVCSITDDGSSYTCGCVSGFSGDNCEIIPGGCTQDSECIIELGPRGSNGALKTVETYGSSQATGSFKMQGFCCNDVYGSDVDKSQVCGYAQIGTDSTPGTDVAYRDVRKKTTIQNTCVYKMDDGISAVSDSDPPETCALRRGPSGNQGSIHFMTTPSNKKYYVGVAMNGGITGTGYGTQSDEHVLTTGCAQISDDDETNNIFEHINNISLDPCGQIYINSGSTTCNKFYYWNQNRGNFEHCEPRPVPGTEPRSVPGSDPGGHFCHGKSS